MRAGLDGSGNDKWKGMTWGMIPLHASGKLACTHHFFYNLTSLQFVVKLQAFFTLLGIITVAIAAYRIAIRTDGHCEAQSAPGVEDRTEGYRHQ